MNDVYIYGLIDSTSNELRYVGKTVNLNRRYRRHISERNLHDSYKDRWIRKLINNGHSIELVTIDIVNNNDWKFWESHYISYFKTIGCRLTNGTNGGDQPPTTKGRHHTEESKLKMSNFKIGKPIPWLNNSTPRSDSHKQNLSKSLIGRTSPNKDKLFNKEWCENLSKGHNSQKKTINQLDLQGNFIKEWESIRLAEKTLNIRHISECCGNYRNNKTSGGFKWEYKN